MSVLFPAMFLRSSRVCDKEGAIQCLITDGLQDSYLTEKESESWGSQDQNPVILMPRP